MITPFEIVKRIQETGNQAYFVGGYVRDKFLGIESADIDITTNMKYTELENLFSDCELNYGGTRFQVLFIDQIEVATYREDVYDKEGKLIKAIPCESIEEDLARRDLTINSIAWNPITDEIIDEFNGQNDIKKKIIRFTGNPIQRIMEDPIRMLRACRFLALIELSRFSRKTFFAIRSHSHLIKDIPKERIRLEIIKAMKAKNAGNFFRALKNTDLLQYIFPKMMDTVNHDGGIYHSETIFDHCAMVCDEIDINNSLLKLAAFLHDIGKPLAYLLNSNESFKSHDKIGSEFAEEELKNLKFNSLEIKYITSIINLHMSNLKIDSTSKTIRRLLVKLKENDISYEEFLCHKIADHNANMKKEKYTSFEIFSLHRLFEDEIKKSNVFSIKDLEINGNDVMNELGIGPGPEIGRILKGLFEKVVDDFSINNHETLLSMVKEI